MYDNSKNSLHCILTPLVYLLNLHTFVRINTIIESACAILFFLLALQKGANNSYNINPMKTFLVFSFTNYGTDPYWKTFILFFLNKL